MQDDVMCTNCSIALSVKKTIFMFNTQVGPGSVDIYFIPCIVGYIEFDQTQ